MRTVLLQGVQSIIGTFIASYLLEQEETNLVLLFSADQVLTRADVESRLQIDLDKISDLVGKLHPNSFAQRAHWATYSGKDAYYNLPTTSAPIQQVWSVADALSPAECAVMPKFLAQVKSLGAEGVNLVVITPGVNKHRDMSRFRSSVMDLRAKIEAGCLELNLRLRVLKTSLVVDGLGVSGVWNRSDPFGLSALMDLRSEIEGRVPEYFDYQALRVLLHERAEIDFVYAHEAANRIVQIATEDKTRNALIRVASKAAAPAAEICEMISQVSGISVLPVSSEDELNEVDKLFRNLLSERCTFSAEESEFSTLMTPTELVYSIELEGVSGSALLGALSHCWSSCEEMQQELGSAVQALPKSFRDRSVLRGEQLLKYVTLGREGPIVVILNALGQGLEYWKPLLSFLVKHYRIILWATRGLDQVGAVVTLEDHVGDIEAILDQEACEECDMVCWCTGPKAAIHFSLLHPGRVRSLIFLNGTFKAPGVPSEWETEYECNLESLVRVLMDRRGMVNSIMRSLQATPQESEAALDAGASQQELSLLAMSLPARVLRESLVEPFRSEASTVQYAEQLVDFWGHDSLSLLRTLQHPILFIASENDSVASPEMSRQAVRNCQFAEYEELPMASHHCLYERPRVVADRIHRFIATNSDNRRLASMPLAIAGSQ